MSKCEPSGPKPKYERLLLDGTGGVIVEPCPVSAAPRPSEVLVRSVSSLISPGTELTLLRGAHTLRQDYPLAVGYCNAGDVVAVGEGVTGLRSGDRVASGGPHAALFTMPADHPSLCRIPESISYDQAAFMTLACIALYGVRRASICVGDSVAVIGQGLVGQLCIQLARLSGARPTIAIDLDRARLKVSADCGADYVVDASTDVEAEVGRITDRKGVARVIEASGSRDGLLLAFKIAGKQATVSVVGAIHQPVEMNFYREHQLKELTVVGNHGRASPSTILGLMAEGSIKLGRLITHKVHYRQAARAYELLMKRESLGVVLDWSVPAPTEGAGKDMR